MRVIEHTNIPIIYAPSSQIKDKQVQIPPLHPQVRPLYIFKLTQKTNSRVNKARNYSFALRFKSRSVNYSSVALLNIYHQISHKLSCICTDFNLSRKVCAMQCTVHQIANNAKAILKNPHSGPETRVSMTQEQVDKQLIRRAGRK